MKLFLLGKYFLWGISVLMLFSGCSASSSSQRFKQNKSDRSEVSSSRFDSQDTAQASSKFDQRRSELSIVEESDSSDEFDESPTEEHPFTKEQIEAKLEKLKVFYEPFTTKEKVLFEVIKYLETPYKYGGNTKKGLDCSAFTLMIYKNSLSIDLPRSASQQYRLGDKIGKDSLKFGDLVFFNTRRKSFPGHVGIFLGDDQFVHASRKLGVTVSSLDEVYYKKRYVGARRVELKEEE